MIKDDKQINFLLFLAWVKEFYCSIGPGLSVVNFQEKFQSLNMYGT